MGFTKSCTCACQVISVEGNQGNKESLKVKFYYSQMETQAMINIEETSKTDKPIFGLPIAAMKDFLDQSDLNYLFRERNKRYERRE